MEVTQGFSVRVMKGVSYRFGDFEAAAEKRVSPLDTGHFILTNKRLIFSGTKKISRRSTHQNSISQAFRKRYNN